jgi:hypothetical protein
VPPFRSLRSQGRLMCLTGACAPRTRGSAPRPTGYGAHFATLTLPGHCLGACTQEEHPTLQFVSPATGKRIPGIPEARVGQDGNRGCAAYKLYSGPSDDHRGTSESPLRRRMIMLVPIVSEPSYSARGCSSDLAMRSAGCLTKEAAVVRAAVAPGSGAVRVRCRGGSGDARWSISPTAGCGRICDPTIGGHSQASPGPTRRAIDVTSWVPRALPLAGRA